MIKKVDPILAASIRDIVPNYPEQEPLWNELGTFLNRHRITPTGPCFTIHYSEEPNVDTEVCEPVSKTIPPDSRIKMHELPRIPSITTMIHKGAFHHYW